MGMARPLRRQQQLAFSNILPNDWAMPVAQGYDGEPFVDYPYMENSGTADVLETENDPVSKQARYPYLQYYGQATSFDHANGIDGTFYDVSIACLQRSCIAAHAPYVTHRLASPLLPPLHDSFFQLPCVHGGCRSLLPLLLSPMIPVSSPCPVLLYTTALLPLLSPPPSPLPKAKVDERFCLARFRQDCLPTPPSSQYNDGWEPNAYDNTANEYKQYLGMS